MAKTDYKERLYKCLTEHDAQAVWKPEGGRR